MSITMRGDASARRGHAGSGTAQGTPALLRRATLPSQRQTSSTAVPVHRGRQGSRRRAPTAHESRCRACRDFEPFGLPRCVDTRCACHTRARDLEALRDDRPALAEAAARDAEDGSLDGGRGQVIPLRPSPAPADRLTSSSCSPEGTGGRDGGGAGLEERGLTGEASEGPRHGAEVAVR